MDNLNNGLTELANANEEIYKCFVIDPDKGVTIKDINDITLLNDGWWKIGYIKLLDIYNWKSYKIRYYNSNEGDLYMRPVELYNCNKFEDIFGFGYQCEEFSTDKIIRIKFN